MSKIYTKTGDKGETSLLGGDRVRKSNVLVNLYGEVDELNSFLGLAAVYADDHKELLQKVQSALFDLGALLSCPKEKRDIFGLKGVSTHLATELENEIDKMDTELEALKSFILPGGHVSAANFHVVRTVARRVERQLVEVHSTHQDETLVEVIKFLNRLSDFLFVMARYYNKKAGVKDIPWIPGE